MTFRFLTSYHSFRNYDFAKMVDQAAGRPLRLFADSGAFSALSIGAEVTLENYAEWLLRWKEMFTVYVNLDVIGNPEATMENQCRLEQEFDLQPIPVFHVGSDFSVLEGLCEEYPYLALGGMVPYSQKRLGSWLLKCFSITEQHGTRVHGFGQTRHEYLMDFPFYSVDSSSWASGHMFGNQSLWNPKSSQFVAVKVGNPRSVYKHADLIRSYGVDPADIAESERWHRNISIGLARECFSVYERFLQARWSGHADDRTNVHLAVIPERPRLFMEHDEKFRMYLATSPNDIEPLLTHQPNLEPSGDPS